MDKFRLKQGDVCVVNENAKKFYPSRFDTKVTIVSPIFTSFNFDYEAETEEGELLKFRDCELTKLNKDDLIVQLRKGQKVVYAPTNEIVTVEQISLLYGQVGIKFPDNGVQVVGIEVLREAGKVMALDEGKIVIPNGGYIQTMSRISTDKLINTFLNQYKNNDNTYTLPKSLLEKLIDMAFEEVPH